MYQYVLCLLLQSLFHKYKSNINIKSKKDALSASFLLSLNSFIYVFDKNIKQIR